MNSKKINTFIFDCFGVIYDPVINSWYTKNRLENGLVDENLQKVLEQFDLGKLSEDDMLNYFLRYEGINSTKEKLREDIDSYLKIDTNLVKIIKKLKERKYKVVLLSNANASFFERKIYKIYPEFKNLFDEIVISSEVGMVKPNNDIYLYTLEKIGSRPEESLFIDDSKTNIDAAISLGIESYLYTNSISFSNYLKTIGINI